MSLKAREKAEKHKRSNTTKKYTTNVKRNIWTKYNSKRINKILEILTTKINFKSDLSSNVDVSFYKISDDDEILIDEKNVFIELKEEYTYTLLGGIVYNLLYKKIVNFDLNNFVDHTSDIDVVINKPQFYDNEHINNHIRELEKNDEINAYVEATITNKDGKKELNSLYENYSHKIYDELLENLNVENIDMTNTVKFDINEYNEYATTTDAPDNVFLHNEIGNAHLIRIYNNQTNDLKIQLVLKIQHYNETVIDNIFEIIINCSKCEWIELLKNKEKQFDVINVSLNNVNTDINVQKIKGLVTDNFEAYKNRKQNLESNYLKSENFHHKPINHIGRLLYLLFIFKNVKNNDYVRNNINEFCIYFTFYVKMYVNKKIDVLKYFVINKYNYHEYDIIDIKMIDIMKAFIDVFYDVSSDGVITKRTKNMYDNFFFNNKNINDIFKDDDIFLKEYKFDQNEPIMNAQYNNINNIINENSIQSKLKNLNIEFKMKYGNKNKKLKEIENINQNKNNKTRKPNSNTTNDKKSISKKQYNSI